MPPKRKRSRLFLTLDRKGKKKRSGEGNIAHTTDEAEPVDGGDESLELPPPLFHSTPSKGENATRREANQENTSLGSSDITCKWCNTSIKLPEVNEVDNIYGILCFSCGNINRLPNTMGGNGSTCNHSVLVAYELCHRCGSYGENKSDSGINRSHTHSHIGDGQVCDKCGFGLTKIHDTKSNNELNVPDDTLHNRDTDIVGKDVQVETSPSVESEGDLTFKKNTDIFAGPDTVSSRKDEVVDSDKETEDGNNITEIIEKIMPEYTKVLQTCETGDILKELLISLSNGQLQADSLTYAIFIDTLKALNATSLTEMRYSFLSKLFWKTFLNKFGAAPLRFLSGWKHAGSLLLGKSDRGSFAGAEANIIFSIPNEGVLKMFDPYEGEWPNVIAPGICHQVVDKIAAANKDTSICIAFDGKKVSPGLRGDKGDINLLGRENEVDGLTPAEQKAVHVTELQDVNSIKQLICSERNAKSLDQMKSILDKLRKLLTHLTVKKALTRETLGKKTYALEKLKSRAAQDSSATSSKYQYPISLVTANIIELKELDATGDRLREELAEICVKMIKGQGSLPNLSVVNISEYWRYHSLQDIDLLSRSEVPLLEQFSKEIINMGLRFVKQRSTFWFKARSEVKVTASTLYNALGCAGLKAQKEHYQQTVLGFDRPATPSNVQEAMDWGTKHEICALSTIVSKVIPVFYPECCLLEVGAFKVRVGNVDIIISPDGYLYNNVTHSDEAGMECKCPKNGWIPNMIPPRYYLQVQAHIRSTPNLQWCMFCVWTEETTKVFRVERDEQVWALVEQELNAVYGGDNTRCPSRLSSTAKAINKMIRVNIPKTCQVIVEVLSVHSCLYGDSNDENGVIKVTESDPYVTCIYHENVTVDIDSESMSSLNIPYTLDEVIYYLKQHYQLSRKKATEVIAFVACNTDRLWSADIAYGAPICYFLKGYSLPSSVVRNILEDVLSYCHEKGVHCPVQSFDGQYAPLLQTSKDGKPQTILQLQKLFWKEVCAMTKPQLLAEMKTANCVSEVSDVTYQTIGRGVYTVNLGHKTNVTLPQTAFKFLKKKQPVENSMECQENGENVIHQIVEDLPENVISIEHETWTQVENMQQLNDSIMKGDTSEVIDDATVENSNLQGEDVDVDNDNVDNGDNIETASSANSNSNCILESGDIRNMLSMLRDQTNKWCDKNAEYLQECLLSCSNLAKLTVPELKIVLRYLRDKKHYQVTLSGCKEDLITRLKSMFDLSGEVPVIHTTKKFSPIKLSQLCLKVLNGKNYPKLALSVSYANWKFPSRVAEWRKDSRIKHDMVIPEVNGNKPINWFYIPEYSKDRNELFVRKIDPHHLLTRHRSALCKRNIGSARKSDFLDVAKENKTSLKLGMMEDSLDMQSTDFSLITFSSEVEAELQKKGYTASANMCHAIRQWFESMDNPGISATERCRMKFRYRDVLLSMTDLSKFPPPGMYVQGYPKGLWESTIASIDADIILYGLVRRRTYNQRAVSSQLCESLFASMATMPGTKNGVPNCCDLETDFAKICGEVVVRYDPNRGFPIRLTSSAMYPNQQLEMKSEAKYEPMTPPTFISEISVTDHPFDSPDRCRTARRKPKGLSGPHEPARGVTGVRTYHKVNEGRLSALTRMGKSNTIEPQT